MSSYDFNVFYKANLWSVIMYAMTGFSEQDWITKEWENNYHITALAGSENGHFLVLMSKGSTYEQQCYKIIDSFPFKWINKK
ncbi:hypothetical protein ZOSMA_126G00050 [Zostera marina]|uniref:DUF7477 domain-containing protein n=1 Tax=Zostera marina TaxID=29655 RepID=A0A0K9Q012_ZOSMR|nr:hypothetical protein ZOSMA_126G00050 [Zostera marina]